jgi:ribosomal protein S18 acetylase RimI-like enzyme
VIHSVTAAAYAEYRGLLEPPSGVHAETTDDITRVLSDGGVILGTIAGETVGAVRWSRDARDGAALYVGRLAVLPACRRQGIGRALMSAVEARAREMGFLRVTLGVRDQLPGNRAFYESLGYRVDGEGSHDGYDRVTWFTMSKAVGQGTRG